MVDMSKIDEIATLGYNYASGNGIVPVLSDQFEIDCFNAGISNYNTKRGANIAKIKEGMNQKYGASNICKSDKELAIIGA